MEDQNQNPGRKWRKVESDGDGNRYFESFRFTPYTTDLEFYRDPGIYETEVRRSTQDKGVSLDTDGESGPRGNQRTDVSIQEEIQNLFAHYRQADVSHVRVDVREGVVTLTGYVNNPDEMRTAEGMTRNVLGVLDVNNQLQMNSPR